MADGLYAALMPLRAPRHRETDAQGDAAARHPTVEEITRRLRAEGSPSEGMRRPRRPAVLVNGEAQAQGSGSRPAGLPGSNGRWLG